MEVMLVSIKTKDITIEDLLEQVKTYNNNEEDLKLIKSAYDYAYKKHFGQKRISGDDYITHPLNVAWILTEINADAYAISAALLHDTIEDSDSTKEDIDANFLDMLFTNNAMKTRRHGWLLIVFLYIKSVGVYSCHSFHAERPSHCPILLNEQRQKPTPICIRKNYLYPKGYKVTMHNTHP